MIANLQGTPARLCQVLLTTTNQAIYTAQSDGRSVIMDLNACNVGITPKTMTIYINTADSAHCLLHHSSIAASDTYRAGQMFVVLNKNETLYAVASGDDSIVLTVCGLERV